MHKWKVTFYLGVCLLLFGGCATIQKAVPDVLKSQEQIKVDQAMEALELAQQKQKDLAAAITPHLPAPGGQITNEIITNRRDYLGEREAYVKSLVAEFNLKIASLEKKSKKSGYFALGTKGLGIASGIASAALVVASPANAAIVAGLGAFSAGILVFEDKATEVGYSTVVAQGQIGVLKDKAKEAYIGFKDVPWEYLNAIAATADDTTWANNMKTLGAQIVAFESAVRYTKYDIQIIVQENR